MNLSALLLKWAGWHVSVTAPDYDKCLICVAPHTSNWDFVLCKLAYASVHRHAGFLMKSTWFFWPLGPIFKAMGGVPVPRVKGSSLSAQLIRKFNTTDHLQLAITPEGTRKRVSEWRTGFLHIAVDAHLPIILAVLDYGTKTITAETTFIPTGDIKRDMADIKAFYKTSGARGKYPEKFCAD